MTTGDVREAAEHAARRLAGFSRLDQSLAPLTTYRVGGPAAVFAAPRSIDELAAVGEVAEQTGLPVIVVGRGSNMLVADDGFAGIAVSLAELSSGVDIEAGGGVVAGGAAALPVVARRTVAAGLTGFEWAVGVPGSIGGAVRMNAGGHGSDMAACVSEIHRFDLRSGHHGWVPVDQLGLRFRGSQLTDADVVLAARLQLGEGDVATGEALLAEIVRWRREHQPGGQNAGSVFVNPVPGEVSAGELIDRAGLRGFRIGGAEVSSKHANFIQAADGGRAADVHAVIEHVRAAVAERTGYTLRSEVRLVGFHDVPTEVAEVAE